MYATRPREHATRIAELPTLEARREALAKVPREYQAMVKNHLAMIFRLKKR